MVALLGWVIARSFALNVPSWARIDPDTRLGMAGRRVVAALVGFGMGGLSSSFAPWPLAATIAAALAGAVAAAWYAGWAVDGEELPATSADDHPERT